MTCYLLTPFVLSPSTLLRTGLSKHSCSYKKPSILWQAQDSSRPEDRRPEDGRPEDGRPENRRAESGGGRSSLPIIVFWVFWLLWTVACSFPAHAQDASSLQARFETLREQLTDNHFQRPLYIESSERSRELQGDVYALIEQPYTVIGPALVDVNNWCDILILHLNVKGCRRGPQDEGDALLLNVGRKFDQPLADTHPFAFSYRIAAATPNYLQVAMRADKGPLGTSRYRVTIEVVELDAQSSFLHLSYSYRTGVIARLATGIYLATTGRDKVGFSIVGHKPDGEPVYAGKMRGVIERNTMRYYLAIEAFLGALTAPASEQLEKRLSDWYAGVERYPIQLHEMERDDYLAMKRNEIQRQRQPSSALAAK